MATQREIFFTKRDGAEYSIPVGASPGPVKEYIKLNFTPKQACYMLLAGALIQPGVAQAQEVSLTRAGVTDDRNSIQVANTSDQREAYFCVKADYTGGAYNDSWALTYGGITSTVGLNKAFVCAIEITNNDQFTDFTTEKSGTQTTYQDWESRTIPAGNWLLMAYAINDNLPNNNDTSYIKVYDGTSSHGETLIVASTAGSFAEERPWSWVKKVTLGSSTTYTVQVKCGAGNGYYFRRGFFIAINLDDFANNYFAESTARSTSAVNGLYVDKTTLTIGSPTVGEHLLITSHYIDSVSTGNRVGGRVLLDSDTVFDGSLQVHSSTELNDYNYFWVDKLNLTTGVTIKSQFARLSGSPFSPNQVGMGESAIAVLQTETQANLNLLGSFDLLGSVGFNAP